MPFITQETVLVIVSSFNLCIGIFVFWYRPERIVNRMLCAITLGIALWGFGLTLLTETHDFSYNTVMFYGFSLFIFGFVTFARTFPNTTFIPKKFYLIFLPLAGVPLAALFGWIIKSATYDISNHPAPVNGPLFPFFVALSLFYFLLGFYFFRRTYRTSVGVARIQIYYLLFGLGVLLLSTLIFDMLLPILGVFKLNFLGPISSIVLTGMTAYAIVRHQLMDIRIIIQRSLIYAILLGLTVAFYLASVSLIGFLFNSATGTSTLLGGAITTLFGIFTVPLLEQYFRKITDPIFFKDHYNYAEALHQLSKILYTSVRQGDIMRDTSALLRTLFKTEYVAFRLIAESTTCPFPPKQVALIVPILFEQKEIGQLELGEKRSGERYSAEDHKLLETFVFQAAVALEKAKLYEKVEEYSGTLEQLVENRTQEIRKLQEDQKQTMIDISHNLQTPLAIIRGELELVTESAMDADKVRTVKKSLDRVSQFIRQLLHLAKLDNSAFAVRKEPVNLTTLVRDQAEYFEVMANEQGVEIKTTLTPNVYSIGDKRLLEELLTNLVANSLKYRRTDVASHVEISLTKNQTDIILSVRDNGLGIQKDILPNIFTRYVTARSSPNLESTGLGLAICKKIVLRHEGTISATSQPGKGTEVTITFPLSSHNPEKA